MVEVIITVLILAVAGFILFKNLRSSAQGKCNCGSCSTSCPKYSLQNKNKQS